MTTTQLTAICIVAALFAAVAIFACWTQNYSLNRIRSKTVGDGQHGTARWATNKEIRNTYERVPYTPNEWRGVRRVSPEIALCDDYDESSGNNPKKKKKRFWGHLSQHFKKEEQLPQGTVIGYEKRGRKCIALVDKGDVHTLMIGAAGVGKTACFLLPNIEYCCASGMSFLCSDTKGDLYRQTGGFVKHYGYNISVIDLRNCAKSDGFNMLYLVNRYTDEYCIEGNISAKAKAEKYAKITAKTIINSSGSDKGQNAFFYDAAEGLLTAAILLVAEFCEPEKRHIVSVFKLVQDLMEQNKLGEPEFKRLLAMLPPTHRARWYAAAALNASTQAMASVLSTTMSRLNAFLDTEMEQVLCFDTAIDAEVFCKERSAVYIVLPEEDNSATRS